jgi:putative chitinase
MAIDWPKVQRRVGALADGDPGRETYGKVMAKVQSGASAATMERLAQSAAKHCAAYGMTTPWRLCEFLAQIANETGGFKRFEENLNYSAKALANAWGKYSTTGKRGGPPNARAIALANRPEAIANDTYGLRMGNLDGASDNDAHPDGWQYRGRGALQLTGKANYALYGNLLGLDLVGFPELAADPAISLLIALEFFKQGKVNAAVDRGDFREARRITNGGDIGLDHVAELRNRLLTLFL